MRIILGLLLFYQKLFIPSLVISVVLSYFVMDNAHIYAGIGISFIFMTPVFHYFIYDLKNPDEYFFYYNLGLSKITLWISTLMISIITGAILNMI